MIKLKQMLKDLIRVIIGTLFRLLEIVSQIFPSTPIGCKLRGFVYKPFLKSCGKNFQVGVGARLEHLNNIEVGDNVYIGHGSWISGIRGGIIFEDEVMLGPYVKIVSSNHTMVDNSYRFGPGIGKQVVIGFGSWLGADVVVLSGAKVGKSSLVAAGSVVTKSFQGNCVLAGSPARIIKYVEENS